jgi:hypothetical protein
MLRITRRRFCLPRSCLPEVKQLPCRPAFPRSIGMGFTSPAAVLAEGAFHGMTRRGEANAGTQGFQPAASRRNMALLPSNLAASFSRSKPFATVSPLKVTCHSQRGGWCVTETSSMLERYFSIGRS